MNRTRHWSRLSQGRWDILLCNRCTLTGHVTRLIEHCTSKTSLTERCEVQLNACRFEFFHFFVCTAVLHKIRQTCRLPYKCQVFHTRFSFNMEADDKRGIQSREHTIMLMDCHDIWFERPTPQIMYAWRIFSLIFVSWDRDEQVKTSDHLYYVMKLSSNVNWSY